MPCWNDVGRGDYLDQITTGSEWLNLWQFPEGGYVNGGLVAYPSTGAFQWILAMFSRFFPFHTQILGSIIRLADWYAIFAGSFWMLQSSLKW